MPPSWYSLGAVRKIEDASQRELYGRVCASRKPYFMMYIYPALMRDRKKYVSDCERASKRYFGYTISELSCLPNGKATPEMESRLVKYGERMPVDTTTCLMNRICWRFEEEFDGFLKRSREAADFDYTMLKFGIEYPDSLYYSILQIYKEYNQLLADYSIYASDKQLDNRARSADRNVSRDEFRRRCLSLCSNEYELTDILLDACYTGNGSKRFVWDMCGDVIIDNLWRNNDYMMSIPILDPDGDIKYAGRRFRVVEKRVDKNE